MIVEKIIEVKVDFKSIDEIYNANYNKTILNILTKKYKNCCFKSSFILEVLSIVRRSYAFCKVASLDGSLTADIMFKAKVLVFEEDEVIHRCKINNIDQKGYLHSKGEHFYARIKNTGPDIFKVGETIPIIVNTVKYIPFKTEIAITATPFVPKQIQKICYKVLSDGTYEMDEFISSRIEELENEINSMKKSGDLPKVYKFFRELIYPYRKYVESKNCKDISSINDTSLSENYVYFPPQYLDEGKFCISKTEPNEYSTFSISYQELVIKLNSQYLKNLETLYGFLKEYPNLETIKGSSHLWKLYQSLKV